MVENESIVIINDTGLNVEYTINIDGNKTKVVSNDRKSIYPILQTDKDIFVKIRKEDIWQEKHWTNVLLLVIYSFDLVFGNLAEEENLPFFIDYTDNFKLNKGEIKTIFLSEIISQIVSSIEEGGVNGFLKTFPRLKSTLPLKTVKFLEKLESNDNGFDLTLKQ